ncbi:MAG TPA: hypothetical protein VHL57_07400, partial [Flavobacteriales bacterium]|nr:hypothetical protein [Flavobacteriales bacterium]
MPLSLFLFGTASQAQVSAYTFDQGLVTYSSISGTGTSIITGTWDNNVSAAVPLNFTFNFNGTNYTDCIISSNGFITFGTTAPATGNVTPISTATAYAGAISGYGMDLIRSGASDPIRYQTLGSSPNRTFVVEYFGVRRRYAGFFSTQTASDNINFQIRLNETTNTIEVRYGTVSLGSLSTFNTITCQVGLRGSANTQFNNRSTTDDWSATTAGGSNTASCQNGTILGNTGPVANQTYRWTPPRGCTVPTVSATAQSSSQVSVSWTCAGCVGPYVLEYGPSTLLPGAGATAGSGGTVVSTTATSPTVVSGLSALTTYKFAVRQLCGSPLYTANGSAIASTPFDCTTATNVACGAATSFTLNGSGSSAYSTSAAPCNFDVPGQEKLYR